MIRSCLKKKKTLKLLALNSGTFRKNKNSWLAFEQTPPAINFLLYLGDAEMLSGCEKSYMAVAAFVPLPRRYEIKFPNCASNGIQMQLITSAQQVEYSDISFPLHNTGNETIQESHVKVFCSQILKSVLLLFLELWQSQVFTPLIVCVEVEKKKADTLAWFKIMAQWSLLYSQFLWGCWYQKQTRVTSSQCFHTHKTASFQVWNSKLPNPEWAKTSDHDPPFFQPSFPPSILSVFPGCHNDTSPWFPITAAAGKLLHVLLCSHCWDGKAVCQTGRPGGKLCSVPNTHLGRLHPLQSVTPSGRAVQHEGKRE